MIDVEYLAEDALSVSVRGVVDRADRDRLLGALADTAQGAEPVGMLLDITAAEDLAADLIADAEDLHAFREPWGALRRLAVIAEGQGAHLAVPLLAVALPELSVAVFHPDDARAADRFAKGRREGDKTAVTMLASHHPGLIALEVDGVLSADDMERLMDRIEAAGEESDSKISVLVRLTEYRGFDPRVMMDSQSWRRRLAGLGMLHRYAVVGVDVWTQTMSSFARPISAIDIRLFTLDQEDEARDWAVAGL